MKIPLHPGISEDALFYSAEIAMDGPMIDSYRGWYDLLGHEGFVWGAGNPDKAKVLILGEAPGYQEEYTGVPFIGPAGVVLSSVLHASGIDRVNDCFIINTIANTPAKDAKGRIGKPTTNDVCRQWDRVVEVHDILIPNLKAVVLMGGYAYGQVALQDDLRTASNCSREFNFAGVAISRYLGWHLDGFPRNKECFDLPFLVTYHPSFIMRTAYDKSKSQVKKDFLRSFKELSAIIHRS